MSQAAEGAERSAERLKFFTDAVVAIAMTLLILPLLESVAEVAKGGLHTADYLHEHGGQLFSFALSFGIIATFWAGHHSLFEHVERYTGLLAWLNIAWMFTIVWLPVPTAMVGSMRSDATQASLYIGTMCVTSVLMLVMNLIVRRDNTLWVPGYPPRPGALAASLALSILFVLAWVIALVLPDGSRYVAMFILVLTGPVQRLLRTRVGARTG